MALALLLRLKRHLKIAYSLNDARCQAYTPSESIKPGDALSKRDIKEFSTRELPIEPPTTVRQMLEQYQAFKRLLKEDATDYSTYTANIPTKKRGRPSAANHGESAEGGQANGYVAPTRTLRKKSTAAIVDEPGSGDSGEDTDEEWGASGGAKKRKRASGTGTRGRGSRKSVGVL